MNITNTVKINLNNNYNREEAPAFAEFSAKKFISITHMLKEGDHLIMKLFMKKNTRSVSITMGDKTKISLPEFINAFEAIADVSYENPEDIPHLSDTCCMRTMLLCSTEPAFSNQGLSHLVNHMSDLGVEINLIAYRTQGELKYYCAIISEYTLTPRILYFMRHIFVGSRTFRADGFVNHFEEGLMDSNCNNKTADANHIGFIAHHFISVMLIENFNQNVSRIEDALSETEDELESCEVPLEDMAPEAIPAPKAFPCVDYYAKLNELIGLTSVKDQLTQIGAYSQMLKAMEKSKVSVEPISLNMAFMGNPGTAKTTVARIIAGILYQTGMVESPEIIEVGRSGLVGKYLGETAVKVKSLFKKAKGHVLFIDEAYSLVDDRDNSYGDEAITAIVQEMENNRHDTVVIFAGYPDKMDEFFKTNPGLKSRVPFHITFEDYSPEQMLAITRLEAKKRGFTLSKKAEAKVIDICSVASQQEDFGNGRFCRNLVEAAMLKYAYRNYAPGTTKAPKSFRFSEADFAMPQDLLKSKKRSRIGFMAVG